MRIEIKGTEQVINELARAKKLIRELEKVLYNIRGLGFVTFEANIDEDEDEDKE